VKNTTAASAAITAAAVVGSVACAQMKAALTASINAAPPCSPKLWRLGHAAAAIWLMRETAAFSVREMIEI